MRSTDRQRYPLLSTLLIVGLALAAPIALSCTVTADSLSFGVINPLNTEVSTGTATISVSCDTVTTFEVWISAGNSGDFSQRVMMSGEHLLKYNIYRDSSRTQPWGDGSGGGATWSATVSEATATVYGSVPYQPTVYPGSYTDVVTVTVSF